MTFLVALNNNSGIVMVLLDLSAAFGTVDHTLLLVCMKSTGVIDIAHQGFESYVSSRLSA